MLPSLPRDPNSIPGGPRLGESSRRGAPLLVLALALFSPTPSHTAPLFAAPFLSFDTGVNPNFVAVRDLNGDGKPDLAVANGHDNTVSVVLGNADGTFAPRTDHGTGSAPTCVAIADLNGDGKADLVVVNSGSNTVSVFLGGGDGSFTVPSSYVTGATPNFVAIADAIADGRLNAEISALPRSRCCWGTAMGRSQRRPTTR